MPSGNNHINAPEAGKSVRSTIVNEIVSSKPGFLIRWGITIFLAVLLMMGGATFFIHYPDVINGRARLTSVNAPKEVRTHTEGKLIQLLASEGEEVKANAVLGYMEARARHSSVLELSAITDSMQRLLLNNRTESAMALAASAASPADVPIDLLGEVQPAYQTFAQALIQFRQYLSSGYYLQKKGMLQKDIDYLRRLHQNLEDQRRMQQQDISLAKESFSAQQQLKDEQVISSNDFRNEQSKLISKTMSIPQMNASIISNESSQHEKQKEIMQLENEIAQQKSIFLQALNTLKAQLDEWKIKYLLMSPIAGKVAFSGFLQENQQLQANQPVCYINPGNSQYYAEVHIPQTNFAKVKLGQKVLLKLVAYPYQEYGALEGRLEFVSAIPTDSGYAGRITLPTGLRTNYKKTVFYRDGLSAQAEIITDDVHLSDRLLKQVKGIFVH